MILDGLIILLCVSICYLARRWYGTNDGVVETKLSYYGRANKLLE
jgi:hypothetical protein